MTASDAKVLIAAITSTLYDLRDTLPGGVAPASQIYLAMGMNLRDYTTIASILSELGLCKVTSETLALTPEGEKMGKDCSEIYADARAKEEAKTV